MRQLMTFLVLSLFLVSACAQQNPQNGQNLQDAVGQGTPVEQSAQGQSAGSGEVKEFKITAKQFQFEPSTIEVNKGDRVKLIVTSVDVPHGFSIPEYGINERLNPGTPVTIEFKADKVGTFTAFCSVFCGSGHSGMKGRLIVR